MCISLQKGLLATRVLTIKLKADARSVQWVSVGERRGCVHLFAGADNLALVLVPVEQQLPPVDDLVPLDQRSVHFLN